MRRECSPAIARHRVPAGIVSTDSLRRSALWPDPDTSWGAQTEHTTRPWLWPPSCTWIVLTWSQYPSLEAARSEFRIAACRVTVHVDRAARSVAIAVEGAQRVIQPPNVRRTSCTARPVDAASQPQRLSFGGVRRLDIVMEEGVPFERNAHACIGYWSTGDPRRVVSCSGTRNVETFRQPNLRKLLRLAETRRVSSSTEPFHGAIRSREHLVLLSGTGHKADEQRRHRSRGFREH